MEDSQSLKQDHDSDDSSSLDPSLSTQEPASDSSSGADNETKAVNCSKMLVHLALLLAGVVVGVATYFFVAQQEEENFEVDVRKRLRGWQKHGQHLDNHSSHAKLLLLFTVHGFGAGNPQCC
jgi:uncharacterized protein HemX